MKQPTLFDNLSEAFYPPQSTKDFLSHKFDGSDLIPTDHVRLGKQAQTIFDLMKDKKFRTLSEIARLTGYPEASISAQLRNLKKFRFGSHGLNKRRATDKSGLFEYQLIEKL